MGVNTDFLNLDLNLLKPNIIKTWEKPWLNYQPQSLNFFTPEYNYDNKLKSILDTAIDLLKSPVNNDLKKKTSIWGKLGGFSNQIFNYGSDALINGIFEPTDNLSLGMANIFSSGLSSVGNTVFNNIVKGELFSNGLTENAGQAVKGAALGLGTSLVGLGITSAMGDSKLGRFTGTATSTALSDLLSRGASGINPYGFAMNIAGRGLSAALGSSKEYGGTYGNTTKVMDSIYDSINGIAATVPGGLVIAGAMALNKGLSNLFGSTDGMTKTDAILGSAFMPAPIKWANMWGASTTDTFNNQSWQNSEKVNSFMLNAFGDLGDKFDKARNEAGKTYGTFSQGAYRDAQDNIRFANSAWGQVLAMADLNELLNVRSALMTSINNQRYALNIQGGWNPMAIGKQGMKILNNATNHNIGMRLLSGAALIDNKQMILCSVAD